MTPSAVTDSLPHDLVTFARAEGTRQFAVAAVVTSGDRVLFCDRTTHDFDQERDLPGGTALPGETLADALDRILACGYGLSIAEIPRYPGSYDHLDGGEIIRTFAFTATCADPQQICRQARTAHCRASPASVPAQVSTDLARLAGLAMTQTAVTAGPGPLQLATALRAAASCMYCDQAATELIISHGFWLHRTDFTSKARAVNRRITETERAGQGTVLASPAFERIAHPSVTADGRRIPALRFGDPRVTALAGALCSTLLAATGITSKSLRALMTGLLHVPCTPGQMTYDLRRLRLAGLIRRIEHTNRYVLTPDGIAMAVFYTKLHNRLLRPLLAARQPQAPPGLRDALRVLDQHVDDYITRARLGKAA